MGQVSQLFWLITIVAYIFRDRILAFGLMQWLSKITGFAWSLELISLRLGINNMELVLAGFQWANPDGFSKTPYFIEVRRVTVRFEPMSVYRAITDDDAINVRCFEVEGVRVFMEKDKSNSLNMWKCLGFDEAQQQEVTQEVQAARASPAPKLAGTPKEDAPESEDAASVAGDDQDEEEEHEGGLGAPQQHKGRLERKAARKARRRAKKQAAKTAAANAAAAEPDTHWGVPFELDCARCTFRGVKVHAADFLRNSKAAKDSDPNDPRLAIQVKFLELKASQLLVKDAGDRSMRTPFLNELVMQRVVPALINAIVASNKTVILHTAINAGLENAAANARATYQQTAKSAQQGLLNLDHEVAAVAGDVARGLGLEKRRDTRAVTTDETAAAGVRELRVRLLRGRELTRNGARPTPYCVLRVTKDEATGQEKAIKAQSRACTTAKKAEWNESFVLDVASLRSNFNLTLMDKNQMPFGKDHRMGELSLPLSQLTKGEENVAWHELTDTKGKADGTCTGEIELGLMLA